MALSVSLSLPSEKGLGQKASGRLILFRMLSGSKSPFFTGEFYLFKWPKTLETLFREKFIRIILFLVKRSQVQRPEWYFGGHVLVHKAEGVSKRTF